MLTAISRAIGFIITLACVIRGGVAFGGEIRRWKHNHPKPGPIH